MYSPKIILGLLLLWVNSSFAEEIIKDMGKDCDKTPEQLGCHYDCRALVLDSSMCISDRCYCSNIGTGSCRMGNNSASCIAICKSLGKSSTGCVIGDCVCT